MTTICTSASEHPATTNPLAQLRAARRKPVAAIIGATAGLVPVGVYEVGHHELTSWSPIECPKAMIVYAGLLFSALTVLGWSTNMFGARAKALGFTLLLEGIMTQAIAVAAGATAAQSKKPTRARRSRRTGSRKTQPRLAVAAPVYWS